MTHIYLETKGENTSEYVFITTLLGILGKGKDKVDFFIECINGKDNLSHIAPKMQAATAEGDRNIVVFDADFPHNHGGFHTRWNDLQQKFGQLNVTVDDLYLYPNTGDDGDFETLLEKLTRKDLHALFFDCYGDYEKCLGNKYVHPNLKGKLHTYISAQKTLTNSQRRGLGSGQWQFNDVRYWDLNNTALQPLKDFLMKNV